MSQEELKEFSVLKAKAKKLEEQREATIANGQAAMSDSNEVKTKKIRLTNSLVVLFRQLRHNNFNYGTLQ